MTPDQEQLDHTLRVEQMQTAIDQNRLNMKKLEADLKWDGRKFLLQAIVALAAALGAGAAMGGLVVNSWRPTPAAAAPPQVYILTAPGTPTQTLTPAAP